MEAIEQLKAFIAQGGILTRVEESDGLIALYFDIPTAAATAESGKVLNIVNAESVAFEDA